MCIRDGMRNMLNVNVVTVKKPLKRRQARSATGATAASCSPDRCSVLQRVAPCCALNFSRLGATLSRSAHRQGAHPNSAFRAHPSAFHLDLRRAIETYGDLPRPKNVKTAFPRIADAVSLLDIGYSLVLGAWLWVLRPFLSDPVRPITAQYALIRPNTPKK